MGRARVGLSMAVLALAGCHLHPREEVDAGPPVAVQSDDILGRTPTTSHAKVRELLIAWADLEPAYHGHLDHRAQLRSRADADAMVLELKRRVEAGEPFEEMEKAYSEDDSSIHPDKVYEVAANGTTSPAFQALSLRLRPGEVGIIRSKWGWHLVQRLP